MARMLVTAAALIALASAAQAAGPAPAGAAVPAAGTALPVADDAGDARPTRVTLKIHGMGCDNCIYIVQTALADVIGVRHVALQRADEPDAVLALITCDGRAVSSAALSALTADLGYPSEVVSESVTGQ